MRHRSHAPSSDSEESRVSAAAGIWRRLYASVKMRRLTAALAVVSMLASQAHAAPPEDADPDFTPDDHALEAAPV